MLNLSLIPSTLLQSCPLVNIATTSAIVAFAMLVIGSLFSAVVDFVENRLARLADFSSFPPWLDADCSFDRFNTDATICTMTSEFMACTYEIFKHSDDLVTTFMRPHLSMETKHNCTSIPTASDAQSGADSQPHADEAYLTPPSRLLSSPCPSLSPSSDASSPSDGSISPLPSPVLYHPLLSERQADIVSLDDDSGELSPLNLHLTLRPSRKRSSHLLPKKVASLASARTSQQPSAPATPPASSSTFPSALSLTSRRRAPSRHSSGSSVEGSGRVSPREVLRDFLVNHAVPTPSRETAADEPAPRLALSAAEGRDAYSVDSLYGRTDLVSAASPARSLSSSSVTAPASSIISSPTISPVPSSAIDHDDQADRPKFNFRPLFLPQRVARRRLAELTPKPQLRPLILPRQLAKRNGTTIIVPSSRSSSLTTPLSATTCSRYQTPMTSSHSDIQRDDLATHDTEQFAQPRRCRKGKQLDDIISLLDMSGVTKKVEKGVQASPPDEVRREECNNERELPKLVIPERSGNGWEEGARSEGSDEVYSEREMQRLSQEIDNVLSVISRQDAQDKDSEEPTRQPKDEVRKSTELAYAL
ncbi:hypothetical protein OBBRIDRAFT_788813 [Obba rivulosa]|uniref:Uncharacterized protein n=1 Tax=Obba rivulosa TaxID=1052685 RepID=A0A8E2J726_9APHY|nr:hypothetical protein OBBRIDRAFT_788813 [Obba rivulosa]